MQKQSRFFSFEFVRAIGVIAIFLCHYLQSYDPLLQIPHLGGGNLFISRYLGSTFNIVFITISAILFGLKYEKENYKGFEFKNFMYKRTTKIASSLYPFLISMFIIYWLVDVKFNIKDVLMNFAFLSWFDKQPAIGHLWFITMIMACYTMFVILSKKRYHVNSYIWIIIFILCISANYFAETQKLPAGYSLLYLATSCFLFLNASRFIDFTERISFKVYIPIFLIINITTIFLFLNDSYSSAATISYLLGCICGISWMIILLKAGPFIKNRGVYIYLSSISYEIYLVHHPLCHSINGYSVKSITQNPYLAFLIIASLTLIIAILLNAISKKISNLLIIRK